MSDQHLLRQHLRECAATAALGLEDVGIGMLPGWDELALLGALYQMPTLLVGRAQVRHEIVLRGRVQQPALKVRVDASSGELSAP